MCAQNTAPANQPRPETMARKGWLSDFTHAIIFTDSESLLQKAKNEIPLTTADIRLQRLVVDQHVDQSDHVGGPAGKASILKWLASLKI